VIVNNAASQTAVKCNYVQTLLFVGELQEKVACTRSGNYVCLLMDKRSDDAISHRQWSARIGVRGYGCDWERV